MINIKHNKDLITFDSRTKQIRFIKNWVEHGQIYFIDLSQMESESYEWLFKNEIKAFKSCLKEDIYSNTLKRITIKNLKVLSDLSEFEGVLI